MSRRLPQLLVAGFVFGSVVLPRFADTRPPDDVCRGDDDCDQGEYCQREWYTSDAGCGGGRDYEDEGRCMPDGSREAGEPCTEDRACVDDLVCSDVDDRCRAPAGEGETCRLGDDCETGLRCGGTSFDASTPRTCQRPRAEGEACVVEIPYGFGNCDRGLVCNTGLEVPVCTQRSQPGERCGTNDDCAPGGERGTICDEVEHVCKVLYASEEGEACRLPAECQYHLTCARWLETPVCHARLGQGALCQDHADCGPGLDCGGIGGEQRCVPDRRSPR